MYLLRLDDIEFIESHIATDSYLNALLRQKREIKLPPTNIFDFDSLIPYMLKDCLVEFIAEKTKSSPCTYEEFIKSIDGQTRCDSSLKRNFSTFHQNVMKLQKHLHDMLYIPPFVSYVCQSLISQETENKQIFRNYKYIFFNQHFYLYIICKSECVPYFHKDRHLSFNECKKFFELFHETIINSPLEKWISQHYIDKYLRPILFAQTWNTLNENELNGTDSKKDILYELHVDNFLSLCNLLQESSGILIKEQLFNKIKTIYFDKKCDILFKEFSSPSDCFKQCALELIIWNNIISPYLKHLYFQQFNALLKDNFTELTASNLYKQFDAIINSYTQQSEQNPSDTFFANEIKSLDNNIKTLDNLSSKLLSTNKLNKNYFCILDKFYGTSPYKTMSDYSHLTSYAEIYNQARLDLDVQLISNRINITKLISY